MSALFRRHSCVSCFFCNTAMPLPPNPRSFRCSACGCWNRYSERGEILSDEPAMHEEQLNRRSFMKRASPSKNQLPTKIGGGPFCHNCQTNQTLVINLLSNYLPALDDEKYGECEKQFEEYKRSLYERYPPVCEDCQPAVEEELYKKEKMAASKALDGSLSRGKHRVRHSLGVNNHRDKVLETFWWKVRGALWVGSSVASVALLSLGLLGRHPIAQIPFLTYILPVLAFVSLIWTMWDPSYVTIQKAQTQGRDVRVHGRFQYCVFQAITWLSRLVLSLALAFHSRSTFITHYFIAYPKIYLSLALASELSSLLAYPLCIRIQHPPPIRLIDTQAHRHTTLSRASTPASSLSSLNTPTTGSFSKPLESDLFATLNLSNKPVITPPNPIFGLPSLMSTSTSSSSQSGLSRSGYTQSEPPRSLEHEDDDEYYDENAMDWSPTNGDSPQKRKRHDAASSRSEDSAWLRPQRFFAPEKPTGLESLFERTKLVDDDAMRVDGEEHRAMTVWKPKWRVWIPILFLTCALPMVVYYTGRMPSWKLPSRFNAGDSSARSDSSSREPSEEQARFVSETEL